MNTKRPEGRPCRGIASHLRFSGLGRILQRGGAVLKVLELEQAQTYGVQVGRLWVAIDFEAQAVSLSYDQQAKSARTEEVAGSEWVLIDRNADGEVIAVEVLG